MHLQSLHNMLTSVPLRLPTRRQGSRMLRPSLLLLLLASLSASQTPPPEVRDAINAYLSDLNSLCENNSAPKECKCLDNSKLSPPWNVFALARCKPTQCTCTNNQSRPAPIANIQRPPPIFERALSEQASRIRRLCSGQPPRTCRCTLTPGILTNPGNANKELLGICGANRCTCNDGNTVNVPKGNDDNKRLETNAKLPSLSFGFGK